jgi:hypothetical protein
VPSHEDITLARLVAPVCVVAAAALLAGCTSHDPQPRATLTPNEPPSPASIEHMEQTSRSLSRRLRCSDATVVTSDLTFFDDARGFDCFSADGEPIFVRVFDESNSVAQVLQDWGPTLLDGRTVVTGPNWFAIGPSAAIEPVTSETGASDASTNIPTPVPLTASQDDANTCIRFIVSAAGQSATERDHFAQMELELDELYPDAAARIRELVEPALAHDIRTAGGIESASFLNILEPIASDLRLICNLTTD